jgi:PAS domain S-box-containing protein
MSDASITSAPADVRQWLGTQLFEHVPINIIVIDRDYRAVLANRQFKEVFGDPLGKHCYEVYKRRDRVCEQCLAARTFEDGAVHVSDEEGVHSNGTAAHYVVTTAPVYDHKGTISHVIEMSSDVTEARTLQRSYDILFERAPCYVSVINRDLRVVRANERLRATFGEGVGEHCYKLYKHRDERCPDCPALRTFADGKSYQAEQIGTDINGQPTTYMVSTSPLAREGADFAHVIEMSTDITALKRLEQEKLDNERLAAVGQTVAQLAHGIKNILNGLQGGMYIIKSGTRTGQQQRVDRGWGMLERNVDRITVLVKEFLSFSKGHTPDVRLTDPNSVGLEVYELYHDAAAERGIDLQWRPGPGLAEAAMDPDEIHTCLANLVSNAMDACQASDNTGCTVTLGVSEEEDILVYSVQDTGCGMEYEIKKKAFTTFFTTKGTGGTGLGLLVTRKIVQEHGGKIHVSSTPGEGSVFRLELPRSRLPQPSREE